MNVENEFIVVDDDAISNMISQLSIRRIWKETRVHLFTEPEKALQFIDALILPPNALLTIFLDINIPSMTGWEFLEAFSQMPTSLKRNFKIFILSSSIDDRDREKALANPLVAGFLSKPLSADTVRNLFD